MHTVMNNSVITAILYCFSESSKSMCCNYGKYLLCYLSPQNLKLSQNLYKVFLPPVNQSCSCVVNQVQRESCVETWRDAN